MSTLLLSKRSVLAATVAGVALIAAGCGGSSDSGGSDASPTSEWADGLCSAISTWKTAISSIGDTVTGGDLTVDAFTAAAEDAKSATETFTSELEDLGKPDTEAGAQAKESIDELATELRSETAEIEETLDGVSGVAGALAAVPAISASLGSMGTLITSALEDLENIDAAGELESAFEGSSSCTDLVGS